MGANRWQGTHQPAQKSIRTMPSSTVSSWFSAVRVTVAMPGPTLIPPAAFPAAAGVIRLTPPVGQVRCRAGSGRCGPVPGAPKRSEEHTSELQSRGHLVCRLLLEKKKYKKGYATKH